MKFVVIAILTLFLLPGDINAQVNFGGQSQKFQNSRENFGFRGRDRPPRLAVQNRYQASPCPENESFCEIAEDFPSDLTNEFGNFTEFYQSSQGDINPRFNFGEEEIRACDVRRSTVFPRKAKTKGGEYMFVLNSKDFRQSIQIESCIGEDQPCLLDEDAPNPGSTSCKQQYASYQLYAVNENGTSIVETFRLPSACTCYHKEEGLTLRFNGNKTPTEVLSPVCNKTVRDFNNRIDTRIVNRNRYRRKIPFCTTSRVFFPGAKNNNNNGPCKKFTPQRCKAGTVCEDTDNYPEDIVRASIQRLSNRIRGMYLKQACLENVIGTRFFSSEGIQLCQGLNRIMVPTSGQNIRGEWKTIVNIPGYTQTINVEECGETFTSSNSCTYSGTFGRVPEQTNCQQLHREHKMLTLNEDTLEIEEDDIKIPSACACFYRKDYNPSFLLRRGEE